MRQPKWKSWGAWASTIALILYIYQNEFDIMTLDPETLLDKLFICGVAWGIWNSPELRNKY